MPSKPRLALICNQQSIRLVTLNSMILQPLQDSQVFNVLRSTFAHNLLRRALSNQKYFSKQCTQKYHSPYWSHCQYFHWCLAVVTSRIICMLCGTLQQEADRIKTWKSHCCSSWWDYAANIGFTLSVYN